MLVVKGLVTLIDKCDIRVVCCSEDLGGDF